MAVQVPKEVVPFVDRAADPDSPHRGVTEADMARQTLALMYRVSGAKHHFWWPEPTSQANVFVWPAYTARPAAYITALDTWTEFSYHGGTPIQMQLPYRMTEGFTTIRGLVSVVSDVRIRFVLRLSSQTLLDAVATTDGDQCIPFMPDQKTTESEWLYLPATKSGGYWQSTAAVILTPTVPSTRRIALTIDAKIIDSQYPLFSLGSPGTVHLMLHNAVFFDAYENE